MKIIFASDNPKAVREVYQTEERVFGKADILNGKEFFADTEYIFSTWGMPDLSEEEIKAKLPSLKAVFYGAGSVQYFARPFLKCGAKVFSAWAANAVPVAEYTVAQIVLANKGFFKTMRYTDRTDANRTLAEYRGNYGVKVGIIGAGMIGKLVIGKLKEYDVETLVFDPFLPDEKAEELGVKKVSLERLFEECDVVSNHLADNPQTRGMLHGRLFETMLPYSTFLNTGRGAQVVEADLIRVLKARPDITAILDVTFPEPPGKESELYTLENCILTPHIAGSTGREVRRMGDYMREEYEKFTSGKPCKYEVTLEMLKTMA
ncbi:MAG: hydroxyacid dehydrogenase [Clostridia bacterium]|nr:hydroxyacid dehydrogenase [Clostridia bacterium]